MTALLISITIFCIVCVLILWQRFKQRYEKIERDLTEQIDDSIKKLDNIKNACKDLFKNFDKISEINGRLIKELEDNNKETSQTLDLLYDREETYFIIMRDGGNGRSVCKVLKEATGGKTSLCIIKRFKSDDEENNQRCAEELLKMLNQK